MTTPLSEVLDDARAHELSAADLWYSEEDYWKERLEELSPEDCNMLEAMAENFTCPVCDGVDFEVSIFQRVVFEVHSDPLTGVLVRKFRLHSDFDGSYLVECADPQCAAEVGDVAYDELIHAVNQVPTQQYERVLA